MKVVCDTNIFISAAEFGGTAEALLDKLAEKRIPIVISPDIVKETARVLERKFRWNKTEIRDLAVSLKDITVLVSPRIKVRKVKKDPSDNKILECAVEGRADFIVTGDKKHLLPLKKFRRIPIMSPQEFLKKMLYD